MISPANPASPAPGMLQGMVSFRRLARAADRLAEVSLGGYAEHRGRWTPGSHVGTAIASTAHEDIRKGLFQASSRASLAFVSSGDHLRALSRLLDDDAVIIGAASTARGCLEAAAVTHYLADPAADPLEIARRYVNLRLADLTDTRLLLSRLDDQKAVEKTDESIKDACAFAERLEFKVRKPKKDWNPPHAGEPAPRIVELVRAVIDNDNLASVIYQHMSAVAHARPSGIAPYVSIIDSDVNTPTGAQQGLIQTTARQAALHHVGALLAFTHAAHRLYDVFGWDSGRLSPTYQQVLSVWREAAGLGSPTFDQVVAHNIAAQHIPDSFRA